MKNLKLLTLVGLILISWTLIGCGSNSKNNETTPTTTTDETTQEELAIEDTTTTDFNSVVSYNDTLVNLTSNCILSEDSIWNAYSNYEEGSASLDNVQKAISDTLDVCRKSSEQISTMGDWEWDGSLKDSVIEIIEKEMAYYAKFSELIPYLWNGDETLSDEDAEAYTQILNDLDSLDVELENANNNLIIVQEEFAKSHWFNLENSEAEEIAE